jgi:hypothetical protein
VASPTSTSTVRVPYRQHRDASLVPREWPCASIRHRTTTDTDHRCAIGYRDKAKDPGIQLATTHAGPNTVSLANGEAYVSNLDASIEHACSKAIHAARSVGEGRSGEWNLFAMSTSCQRDDLARDRRLAGAREASRFMCVSSSFASSAL